MNERKLSTPVIVDKPSFDIASGESLFLIGSCFTENIGRKLTDSGFDTFLNPFGILYNPLSMAEAMKRCIECCEIGDEMLVQHDGLWHSWLHHGSFSNSDKQQCLEACNKKIIEANHFLDNCQLVIVTFGSAWLYEIDGGTVVANCHKVPAYRFEKRICSVCEVVKAWQPLLEYLLLKGKKVIFTVSPVRHGAYGAHGNQLGKAVLLLAIEELMQSFAGKDVVFFLHYFPSYEILMDELRDYRFYADDMLHPSSLAEEIIWCRFQQTYMSKETIAMCDERDKQNRRAAHRVLHG